MHVQKAQRKSFDVDAVRVTAENIDEVAEWCRGDVRTAEDGRQYIKVRVLRPLNENQTMAFAGDWVLYAGTGYKVYVNGAFNKAFVIITGLLKSGTDRGTEVGSS